MNKFEHLIRFLVAHQGSIAFSKGTRGQRLVTVKFKDKIYCVMDSVKEVVQKLEKCLDWREIT